LRRTGGNGIMIPAFLRNYPACFFAPENRPETVVAVNHVSAGSIKGAIAAFRQFPQDLCRNFRHRSINIFAAAEKFISAVNGKQLSTSSQKTLLQGNATKLATEYIDFDDETGKYFWVESDTIEISASTSYDKRDIAVNEIYNVRDKKVGYMLCNNFNEDDFVDRTSAIFEEFIAQNVTDIIIDLRYNTSGKISNITSLASMLVPSEFTGKPFCTLKDNNGNISATHNYTAQDISVADKKIYFIIGKSTQGVAELLVNSVNTSRDMYDVFVIGEKSTGVNIIVEEIKSPYGFAINPATAIAYSANGEIMPGEGVKPDYEFDELAQKNSIYPLGSEQEYLLYNTLYIIVNGTAPENSSAN
jgi:C-terminal processing protease CtpA/Prc